MRIKVALTRPKEAEEFHTLEPGMLRIPPLANMVQIVDINQQIGVLCQKKCFFSLVEGQVARACNKKGGAGPIDRTPAPGKAVAPS
jgi:hypothetical protein